MESLAALEEKIRVVLSVLGLLPSSYHEVSASLNTAELVSLQLAVQICFYTSITVTASQ